MLQFLDMVVLKQVKAAGETAQNALVALREYIENPTDRNDDAVLHGRLVMELDKSINDCKRLISQFVKP